MAAQLILPIGVEDSPDLDNFIDTPNKNLLAFLKQRLEQRIAGQPGSYTGVFIWGEPSSGKSHLLLALSKWVEKNGGAARIVVPEATAMEKGENDQRDQIYLLDDVESFISDAGAERDLLTLIEGIKQQNATLLITARHAVSGQTIELPDLSSRLLAMDSFECLVLQDEDKRKVLLQRAAQRGIILSDEVLNWLFTHTARDLRVLLELLERMDVHSLSQQRKVTIPLIKSILAES